MPTSLVATDIPNLLEGQKLHPWFDAQIILGVPLWFFIALVCLMVLIVVNLYWLFRMKRLKSVRGYVDALKKATQDDVMVWVISTTRNLTIECLHKRDAVLEFYQKTRISKWIHDSPISVVHIGGKGGVMVSEDYYRTRDMVSEIALCLHCDQFNANQERQVKDKKAVNLINDYNDYVHHGRNLLELENPDGLEIPAFSIFDPQKFRKYFPKGLTSMFNGGLIVRAARKKKVTSKQPGWLERYLGLGIFVTVGLIFVIAGWMIPL